MTLTNDFIVKMAEFDYIGQRLTGRLEITCYIGPDVFIYGTIKHVVVHERNLMNSSSSSTFLSFETFGAREQCTCQTSSIFIAIFFLLLYIYKYIYRSAILIVACVGRTANEKKWKERNQTQSAVTLVEALLKTCWGVGTVD